MAFVDNTTGGRIVRRAEQRSKLTVKASTTVLPGDLLGYSAGWVPANATATVIYPEFIAIGRSLGGDEIEVCKRAEIDFGAGSTATAHDPLFLNTTAGQYTAAAPTNVVEVGVMESAQVGVIDLNVVVPGRNASITKTYSTTAATMAVTAATGGTTASTTSTPFGYTTAAQADGLVTLANALRTDVVALAGVLNLVINELQRKNILAY